MLSSKQMRVDTEARATGADPASIRARSSALHRDLGPPSSCPVLHPGGPMEPRPMEPPPMEPRVW